MPFLTKFTLSDIPHQSLSTNTHVFVSCEDFTNVSMGDGQLSLVYAMWGRVFSRVISASL